MTLCLFVFCKILTVCIYLLSEAYGKIKPTPWNLLDLEIIKINISVHKTLFLKNQSPGQGDFFESTNVNDWMC